MKYIGYTTTFLCVAFINSIINGWAFSILWSWFFSATFGLPEISIPVAIGIALTIGFLLPFNDVKTKEKTFGWVMFEAFSKVVFKSLACVGSGWLVLQFV